MLNDVLPRRDASHDAARHPFSVPGAHPAAIGARLAHALGKTPATARDHDWFKATALVLRDRVVDVAATVKPTPEKRVYYLSMEFLIGRRMSDAMGNLGLADTVRAALAGLGVSPERVAAAWRRLSPQDFE